jgi:hypothetical protein
MQLGLRLSLFGRLALLAATAIAPACGGGVDGLVGAWEQQVAATPFNLDGPRRGRQPRADSESGRFAEHFGR